jgi:hypothetical protein
MDSGKMSPAFDLLDGLGDAELLEALRDYSATFTDAASTILSLSGQLSNELVPLRAAKASLEAELAGYRERERDAAETANRQALCLANGLFVDLVAAHTRRDTPVDAEQVVANEMVVSDCPNFDMIAEITPMLEIYQEKTKEHTLIQLEDGNELSGSMESFILRTDQTGLVSCYSLEPLEWLIREHRIDPTKATLSKADLSRLLEEYLVAPYFCDFEKLPKFRGVLLGFLNLTELHAATVPLAVSMDSENWDETLYESPITSEKLRREILPYLSSNCLVRQQRVDEKPLWCRVHTLHHPASVETSSHAVLLDMGEEGDLKIAYVAIGAIRPRKVDSPTEPLRGVEE